VEPGTDLILAAGLRPAELQDFRRRIAQPALLALFDYWLGLPRPRGAMPSRAAIDPTQIPREALSSTMLLEVSERKSPAAAVRLRFRLVGTAVVELREGMTPGDPTGRYMDEVEFREGAEEPIRFYTTVATRCRPGFQTFAYSPRHPRFQGTYHRIAMPLSDDGSRVNMLLAGFSRDAGAQSRG
jgi:PAS domain-containing protein